MRFHLDSIMNNFLKDKPDIKLLKVSDCITDINQLIKDYLSFSDYEITESDITIYDIFVKQSIRWNTTVITLELFFNFWDFENKIYQEDIINKINETKNKVTMKNLDGTNLLHFTQLNTNVKNIEYRDDIINDIVQNLQKESRTGVNIIGEPGIGKTAIIQELTRRIADDNYEKLKDYVVLQIQTDNLLDAKYIKQTIDYALKHKCILFVENVNETVNPMVNSYSVYLNMIMEFVNNGTIKVIHTAPASEFTLLTKEMLSLTRYFATIKIEELTKEQINIILDNKIIMLERNYNLKIKDRKLFIDTLYKTSNHYIKDESMPAKGITILNELFSKKSNQIEQFKLTDSYKDTVADLIINDKQDQLTEYLNDIQKDNFVDHSDVIKIISNKINMPLHILNEDSAKTIKHVEEQLYKHVKGQDDNIDNLMKSVKRYKTNIKDPNKPQTIMMLGPTGVGKTYTTKILADSLFGVDTKKFIRINMNNYTSSMSATNLLGTARGYVDTGKGGVLSEGVRKNPQSIILLDEFEKSSKQIVNKFLQIFDEGKLEDGRGHEVDYRQCIFILTSNAGMKKVYKELNDNKSMGFVKSEKVSINEKYQDIAQEELKELFPDEIVGRIDQFLYYNYLTDSDITKIFDLEINKMEKHINKKITISDKLKETVIKDNFDKQYGARSLKRGIDSIIYDKIADKLINNKDAKELMID